jgi:glycosyltransferase involved in cell wall biosynthesis
MRVLHVYKAYPPVMGGMENHIRILAEAQAALGHQVTVLVVNAARRTARDRPGGVAVIRAARLVTVSSAPVSLALPFILRVQSPDVTHLHSPYPVGEASWLAFGRRPMVLTYQSDIVRQRFLGRLWAPGLRRVLAQADRVLASSPAYAHSSPFLRQVADRVTVVPLGIDTARFSGIVRPPARPTADETVQLVFLGRLRYYKGLDVLLDALALVPRARLLVAGSGPEGTRLRDRAEANRVSPRVRWLGDVPEGELPGVLACADVFVLPSTARSEAYGLAMVEGMAAGLPAVSTELGTGTSWVNQDGKTGLVVPPNDVPAMAGAIRRLMEDPGLRRRMGDAARQRAVAEFDAATMIARVEAVYREVTS